MAFVQDDHGPLSLSLFLPSTEEQKELMQGINPSIQTQHNTTKMTLAPRFLASHVIRLSPAHQSANTIDLYLDYCCPFSSKLFVKWCDEVLPLIEKQLPKDAFDVQIINVVQPWHPTGTYMAETGLAVAQLAPDKFVEFSLALFKNQARWYDEPTYNKTRPELYVELAAFAHDQVGVSVDAMLEKLAVDTSSGEAKNGGNAVAKDLKYFTKLHRQNGVHVTPTVAVNGVIVGSIESSTSAHDVVSILGKQI